MIRIGLFSNDQTLPSLLSSALGKEFDVIQVSIKDENPRYPGKPRYEVILLDLDSLPDSLTFFQKMIASKIPVLILSSDGLRSTAIDLVRQGAYGYCRRPPSIRELKTMLVRAHEGSALRRELSDRQQSEETESRSPILGGSPQIQRVHELIRRVCNINASVLITGESGTGKELIASGIHNLGSRADQPFIAVSCGAIPENLIDTELFGYENDSFTGTTESSVGYLELAGEGTLFLDEIGELSPATQVKLLRVLQQREFSRQGSTEPIPLKARLIFATHQNLSDMVARGAFRQDLYYRMNVIRIDAPPLREHSDDIPQIAEHLLRKYSKSFRSPVIRIEDDAMSMLQAYSWPGNVRELENVIQQALIVANGESIHLEDLASNILEETLVHMDDDYHPGGSFERQLRDYKVKLATSALRESNGNKTLAARSLNISRAYLHRLLRIGEPDELINSEISAERESPEAGMA